jgi:hypothetical protein
MFFYFSFLRTPPQSSLQSSSVVFTPQVTNDLCTEPFPTSIDIFYWWISESYTPQKVTRLSEPTKLTTWRQENAYKPLQIPPPSIKLIGAAAGIDCSLVLSPAPMAAYRYLFRHRLARSRDRQSPTPCLLTSYTNISISATTTRWHRQKFKARGNHPHFPPF